MSTAVRLVVFSSGVLLLLAGCIGGALIVHLLLGDPDDPLLQLSSQKDRLFQILWLVVALCLAITGGSLFTAAVRQRTHNIVPGPTLYVLGLTLVIIGMFLMSAGGLLSGTGIGLLGFLLIWTEYHSAFI